MKKSSRKILVTEIEKQEKCIEGHFPPIHLVHQDGVIHCGVVVDVLGGADDQVGVGAGGSSIIIVVVQDVVKD